MTTTEIALHRGKFQNHSPLERIVEKVRRWRFCRHSGECRNPGGREWKKSGNAAIRCGWRNSFHPGFSHRLWIPAFAGMTNKTAPSRRGQVAATCPYSLLPGRLHTPNHEIRTFSTTPAGAVREPPLQAIPCLRPGFSIATPASAGMAVFPALRVISSRASSPQTGLP